jgi:hypothetical protein
VNCSATSVGGTTAGSVEVKRDTSPPVPAFTGIAAQTFQQALLPPASSVGCSATDVTSGVAGACQVSGYSNALGPHTLTATSTDNAGLTGSASLTYTVIPTAAAISKLSAPKTIKLKKFLSGGLLAKVSVARAGTKLTAELKGPGGKRVALLKRTAGAGRPSLRLRATKKGKALLKNRRRSVLKLAVAAKPVVGSKLTLRKTVVVKR